VQIEGSLLVGMTVIFATAFLGGLAARIIRLPPLLGFIAVGIVVGPTGLRVIDNPDVVHTLAEIGVILLLFSVGIEVSFRDLRELGKPVVFIAVGQMLVTIGLMFPVGVLLGWAPEQATIFGFVVSLSSTIVVLKTLNDRAELRSLHGRILTGIMLVQDLAFIPMMAILPALGGGGEDIAMEISLGMLKAVVVLGATALLGIKAFPWLLNRVAKLGSREIFILMLVAITFVTASVTHAVGLSAAMGAFLAGLVLDESEFGHRALSEIIPI
jgi:CPA2 family monovalent cation:H+ antiporter-2